MHVARGTNCVVEPTTESSDPQGLDAASAKISSANVSAHQRKTPCPSWCLPYQYLRRAPTTAITLVSSNLLLLKIARPAQPLGIQVIMLG